jgi:hypothetical protein
MLDADAREWAQWMLLFTLGGFFGNFVFSLTDHAANGFFNHVEWVSVIARAFAVGFLLVPLVSEVPREFFSLGIGILLLEAVVGVWGFLLHTSANLHGPSTRPFDNFVYGAAPLAPLLFPNLAILGLIALWRLRTYPSSISS